MISCSFIGGIAWSLCHNEHKTIMFRIVLYGANLRKKSLNPVAKTWHWNFNYAQCPPEPVQKLSPPA